MCPGGESKKPPDSRRIAEGLHPLPFLSLLEEIQGIRSPGRSPDLWLECSPPPSRCRAPVVPGGELANHSGGSVRDSHPLPRTLLRAPGAMCEAWYDGDGPLSSKYAPDRSTARRAVMARLIDLSAEAPFSLSAPDRRPSICTGRHRKRRDCRARRCRPRQFLRNRHPSYR